MRNPMFGLRKNRTLKKLPFPQDKELTLRYPRSWGVSANVSLPIDVVDVALDAATSHSIFFIPLLKQPLSSNRYYAVVPHGKHKGEALTSSKEEDATPFCCSSGIEDVKPRPLDPNDVYQQFVVIPGGERGSFSAKSTAADGFPPKFLWRKGWTIDTKTPANLKLAAAEGVNSQLRSRLPELDSTATVGKWYTPFVFVKEGSLRDQVERSMYYEVTLEQRWEQIFRCRNNSDENNRMAIEATVEIEQVFVGGSRATCSDAAEGVVLFKVDGGGGVGLRVELVERMKWEEERGGWTGGEEREVKIKSEVDELESESSWNEFGCYVLVETYNLRRMNGSLVMSYDFKHFNQLKTKWD